MKKNYRFILAFLLAVTFLSTSVFSQKVMANDVRVFMDGAELIYTYVQPHIVNDRTMVPLRETAEHFGMEFTWNPEIATMAFTGQGRTITHTVFSDTLFINGEPMVFDDMTSIIANDRTLMPLRMLAYAIGAAVDWDPSGIVDIWTDTPGGFPGTQPPPGNQPPPQTPPAAGGEARVIAAAAGRLNHNYGEPILIRVETTRGADRVRITDFGGQNTLAESTDFTEDFQGRYFDIYVTPTEAGEITLRVQAGNASGFGMSATNVTINIIPEVPPHTITISNLSLAQNGRVDFGHTARERRMVIGTVRTSTDVVRVDIEDSGGRRVDRITRPEGTTAAHLRWEFEFSPDDINGTRNYYIVAFDRDDNYERLQFSITVVGGRGAGGTTTTTTAGNRIVSVSLEGGGNRIDYWGRPTFIVTTNDTVTGIEVRGSGGRNNNGSWLGSVHNHTTSGANRVWHVSFNADERSAGDYWIYVEHGYSEWYGRQVSNFISGFTVQDN